MRTEACLAQQDYMKAYYINGISEDGSETSFLSAKKSCKNYEAALISTRSQIYAKFLDSMTNYLDDNIAKLLQREAKDSSTIANAFNTLRKQDLDNQLAVLETENDMNKAKAQAQIEQAESTKKLAEAYAKMAESYKPQLQEYFTSMSKNITLESFSKEIENMYGGPDRRLYRGGERPVRLAFEPRL